MRNVNFSRLLPFGLVLLLGLVGCEGPCCPPPKCQNLVELSYDEQMDCLAPKPINELYVYYDSSISCSSADLDLLANLSVSRAAFTPDPNQPCQARIAEILKIMERVNEATDTEERLSIRRNCGCNMFLLGFPGDEAQNIVIPRETIIASNQELDHQGGGSGGVGLNFEISMVLDPNSDSMPSGWKPPENYKDLIQEILEKLLAFNVKKWHQKAYPLLYVSSQDSLRVMSLTSSPLVRIGLIDTGVDVEHPGFQVNSSAFQGWEGNTNSCYIDTSYVLPAFNSRVENGLDDVMDFTGHGTHIAGILALPPKPSGAAVYSTPSNLRILSVKITEEESRSTDLFSAVCGMRYAVEQGVDIMNLSWGFHADTVPEILRMVSKQAADSGILMVAAAGNLGILVDSVPHWPSGLSVDPVVGNSVISVGALATTGSSPTLSEASNYGTGSVQVAAPGTNICSIYIDGEYLQSTGTSMATPFITRWAAALKMSDMNLSGSDLKSLIVNNGELIELRGNQPIEFGAVQYTGELQTGSGCASTP